MINRRRFLGQASCASIGTTSVLNTLLNLKLASHAVADSGALSGTAPANEPHKALVCIFLAGGIDSFNVLVPTDNARFNVYQNARSNLALRRVGDPNPASGPTRDHPELIPLNLSSGPAGQNYGIHPSLPGIAEMFNGTGDFANNRQLSFISNIGTLIEPVTLAQYNATLNGQAGSRRLPKALFSHSDQIEQWQTSVPQGMMQLTGWAGRAADLINSYYNNSQVSMSISLAGNNAFQIGSSVNQFVITPNGSLGFPKEPSYVSNPSGHPLVAKNSGINSLLNQTYANLFERTYSRMTKGVIDAQAAFQSAFDAAPSVTAAPAENSLASSLRAVIKTILISQALGLKRQTFFVQYGGWDHHGELINTQRQMLSTLNQAIVYYQKELNRLGLTNRVLTFTASDFGRTLRSNGRGTDHAWGGNQMVFGGPVTGGRVFGNFPDLALGNSTSDVGYGGRILPTTSVDVHFCEMLRWFGVPMSKMDCVLPNITNFRSLTDLSLPIGYLKNTPPV